MKQKKEKITLLTQILAGKASKTTVDSFREAALKPIIIVYEPYSHSPQPYDMIVVSGKAGKETILYSELADYARRKGGIIVATIPGKGFD